MRFADGDGEFGPGFQFGKRCLADKRDPVCRNSFYRSPNYG